MKILADVQVAPHTAEYPWPVDSAAIDVTLEVLWPSTNYGLQREATTFFMDGDVLVIDLYGRALDDVALPVLWTEFQTVTIPFPPSGEYTIHATLHEAPNPVLPVFVPTWVGIGEMVVQEGGRHFVRLPDGEIARDVDFGNRRIPWVRGRHIFYNNSTFDDAVRGLSCADAIAPCPETAGAPLMGKTALLPGQTATFQNYTSYDKGINGLIIDMDGLPSVLEPIAAENYFQFKVGNDSNPAGWDRAPDPRTVTVSAGVGANDSDRLTVIWDDYAVRNQWLEVTVLANEHTGLDEPDVFYFGNAVGDSGNSTTDTKVDTFDMLGARNNQRGFLDAAPIDFHFDYNRDARVNVFDMLIARNNATHFLNDVELITVPPISGPVPAKVRRVPRTIARTTPSWSRVKGNNQKGGSRRPETWRGCASSSRRVHPSGRTKCIPSLNGINSPLKNGTDGL